MPKIRLAIILAINVPIGKDVVVEVKYKETPYRAIAPIPPPKKTIKNFIIAD